VTLPELLPPESSRKIILRGTGNPSRAPVIYIGFAAVGNSPCHDIIKKFMSAIQASNAFDLLGQSDAAPAPVHLPGAREPQFEIGWGAFRQSFSQQFVRRVRTFLGIAKISFQKFFSRMPGSKNAFRAGPSPPPLCGIFSSS